MGWMSGLSLTSILFVLGGIAMTALCWGSYGAVLHEGQTHLSNEKLKPLICVGLAYLVVAVIGPSIILFTRGELTTNWTFSGFTWSFAAGTAGTFGALGIIIALTNGGKPWFVMPLVFGCAPVVITFISMYRYNLWGSASPMFFAGIILVVAGAVTVLLFAPSATAPGKPKAQAKQSTAKQDKKPQAPSAIPQSEQPKDTQR
ncbi:MAG: hypothetical protein WD045_12200 [Pirellulaceae bacterium]